MLCTLVIPEENVADFQRHRVCYRSNVRHKLLHFYNIRVREALNCGSQTLTVGQRQHLV